MEPLVVKAARHTELEYIESGGVWQVVPRFSLEPGVPVIRGRWVDISQGDEASSRCHVVKAIRRGPKGSLCAEFFAAVPSRNCSQFLLALACTERFFKQGRGASQSNCRKSCANLKCRRLAFSRRRCTAREAPPCAGMRESQVCWWSRWNSCKAEGRHATPTTEINSCESARVETISQCWVPCSNWKWFAAGLQQCWIITERGTLRPLEFEGTTQEIRLLNRLISQSRERGKWIRGMLIS